MAKGHIPFHERFGCSVEEGATATGLGRTKLFELIADKRLDSTLIDGRRVIIVASLRKLVEGAASVKPEQINTDDDQQQTHGVQ